MTDQIAQTASITLITGLPGSGKSLRTVKFCKDAADAGEVVFACNLNGLKVPHVPFEDPHKWRELPPGSILVVDEAQRFFRTRRGGEAPEYITAMETIRHAGIRLVLITQQPDYLDTHLRGLVGMHEHLLRVQGKPAAKIWRHNEVMDNVRSEKARARYDSETWQYPPELFALYESAQVHTVKKVMSSRFKRGLIFCAVALIPAAFVAKSFWGYFNPDLPSERPTLSGLPGSGGDAGQPPGRGVGGRNNLSAIARHEPDEVAEYVARHQARFAGLPWSAPAYDDRAVVSDPRVFCMESHGGIDANGDYKPPGVTCLTEQGTRYLLDDAQARSVARNGEPYNPYRAPTQAAPVAPTAVPAGEPAAAVAPIGVGRAYGDVHTAYGDYGIQTAKYAAQSLSR